MKCTDFIRESIPLQTCEAAHSRRRAAGSKRRAGGCEAADLMQSCRGRAGQKQHVQGGASEKNDGQTKNHECLWALRLCSVPESMNGGV